MPKGKGCYLACSYCEKRVQWGIFTEKCEDLRFWGGKMLDLDRPVTGLSELEKCKLST